MPEAVLYWTPSDARAVEVARKELVAVIKPHIRTMIAAVFRQVTGEEFNASDIRLDVRSFGPDAENTEPLTLEINAGAAMSKHGGELFRVLALELDKLLDECDGLARVARVDTFEVNPQFRPTAGGVIRRGSRQVTSAWGGAKEHKGKILE